MTAIAETEPIVLSKQPDAFADWLARQHVGWRLDFAYCKATRNKQGVAEHQAAAAAAKTTALYVEHRDRIAAAVVDAMAAARAVYSTPGATVDDLDAAVEDYRLALARKQFIDQGGDDWVRPSSAAHYALDDAIGTRFYSVIQWAQQIVTDIDLARRFGRKMPTIPAGMTEAELREFAGVGDLTDPDAAA